MIWDNDTILKFLELYQMHSCIWDHTNESHKNRQHVNDAWNDIQEKLGVPCTIRELKRKKESLMASYRSYKSKIKKSERSGVAADVYQPCWFAFSYMDSFLGSVYICNATGNIEDEITNEGSLAGRDEPIDEPNQSNTKRALPVQSGSMRQSSSTRTLSVQPARKRPKPLELIQAKRKMEEAYNFMKEVSRQQRKNEIDDECTTFGTLIAKKLRKLSENRKDIMMVKINQLFVDEHSDNYGNSTSSYSNYTPSPPQIKEEFVPTFEDNSCVYEENSSGSTMTPKVEYCIISNTTLDD